MTNAEKTIQEFASLTEGIANSQRKGVGLSMSAEEQSLLAFDLEQRFALAGARVMVPAGPEREKQKKAKAKKAKAKKIRESDYLTRLKNSLNGYSGHTHMGEGPFLEVEEIKRLVADELYRQINNQEG